MGWGCYFCKSKPKVMTEKSASWRQYIGTNPEVRFGKPCILGTRISVGDVLSWLASGMTVEQIIFDFPELNQSQILASLAYAADRENNIKIVAA
jgi:uncharacterized protein (DUF433 family)